MVQILPDHLYTLTQWQQRGDWVITPVHLLTHLVRQHPHNGGQGSDAIWWLVHTHIVTKEKRLSDHTCPSNSPYRATSQQWGTRFRCYLMTCILSHNDEREWSHLSFWLTLSGSMATMGTRFRCYWWLVHTHTTTKERRLSDHTCPSDSPYRAAWPLWGQGLDAADDLYTLTQRQKRGDWMTTCPPSDSPYQAAWPLWGQGLDAASKGSL